MPMEQRGVDTIPEEERTSGPRDLVSILLGSNLCLGVIVFGWLPPSFGLGWWASVSSIVVGTLVGTALTAPLALISLRTATNLSTSSGAQFGGSEEQQPVTFRGGQSHDAAPPCQTRS